MAVPDLKMNNGQTIPQVGFGLWLNKDEEECINAVNWALKAGYTHFDSAQAYLNEQFLGKAIKQSGTKREDVFITTKVSTDNMGWRMPETIDESLENLQTDYVDLLLLHFPVTISRRPSWFIMEDIYREGKAKAIGVSNYTIRHLEELLRECEIKPAINQVELHVFLQQPELVDYCKKHDIVVEAYSPLVHGRNKMNDPTITKIAKKHGKTNAQIMIRWCIEIGTVPLPKSVHKERIAENIDVFDFKLDADDMKLITELDSGYRVAWDPTNVT